MKKIIKASVLLLSLSTAFTMNAEPVNTMVLPDAARDKLKAIGLSIEHVEPSPVKDIFTVISREGVSYVSKDGDYIFTGSLFHVKGKDVVNTTEQAILMGVREFASKTKSIDYKSPNEKYRLAIFTDITCGYCQKLHHDLKSYLDAGISIKFLAFPRAGLNSVVAGNMAKIGTVAKLAMRQPFVLFKGLTFQKLCLPGAFRPGDHHNKMLRPGLCVVHASPQYL
ncbi:disulfide isomerase DsbC N-terminal domain-containing protein [Escherichia coli]